MHIRTGALLAMGVCLGLGCEDGSTPPADALSDVEAGTVDVPDGGWDGDVAGEGAPRSPGSYAGRWQGVARSSEGELPLHFVVNEEGLVTDLSVRLQFDFQTGDWCRMNLHPTRLHPVVGDRAEVVVSSPDINFEVVISLRFDSETSAVMSHAGFVGAYRIPCGEDEPFRGDAEILPPNGGQAERVQAVPTPNPAAIKLAGPEGAPVQIGSGIRTCTHQEGRTGEVWCGFARWGQLGESELWVFNLTRLLAGEPIRCEPDSPQHCQRLSETLWTGTSPASGERHPVAHGFTGDTLLFHALDFAQAGVSFSGGIYAWRPGFSEPLLLAWGSTESCQGNVRNDAVACLTNRRSRADGATFYDLVAGKLADGKTRAPKLATLLWTTPQESMDGRPGVLRRGLSPTGEAVAWSVRPDETPGAEETLYSLPLGAPANTRITMATGVTRWDISPDGTVIFYLRLPPGNPQSAVGSLFAARFPGGEDPRLIADNVALYQVVGRPGGPMGLLTVSAAGSLHYLPDVRAPVLTPILVDQDVQGIERLDRGHQQVAYRKWTENGRHDLYVASLAAPAQRCTLAARPLAVSPLFSESGRFVVFFAAELPDQPSRLLVSDLQSCLTVGESPQAHRYYRIPGDRFLILGESRPLGLHGMSRLSLFGTEGSQPFTVSPITDASAYVLGTSSLTAPNAIIYSLAQGWTTDGVYVLPLESAVAPP